ncbi:MAG: hypothetical protein R3D01_02705 [Hyphomicrobiales bacterium]
MNAFLFQYFINYNLKHGWYLTSAPIITLWEAPPTISGRCRSAAVWAACSTSARSP